MTARTDPSALHSRSYSLQKVIPGSQWQDSWPHKGLGLVLKTISHCITTGFMKKGTTRAMVGSPWITYELTMPSGAQNISVWGRTEIILSMEHSAGWKHTDHSHPLKRGPLLTWLLCVTYASCFTSVSAQVVLGHCSGCKV